MDEVLPLEPGLARFIVRNCRDREDVVDIRQEVYERALTAAADAIPHSTRSYIFTIARHVLIDRARRTKVVSFEQVADIESVTCNHDVDLLERQLTARDELRRAMMGLEQLPPRCREVVRLRKVEGLSIRETAERLAVSHHTIERQLTLGLRALANYMLGGEGRIARLPPKAAVQKKGDR